MSGNTGEFCNDWYAATYTSGNGHDPQGPCADQCRVVRGGSWLDGPRLAPWRTAAT